MSEKRPASEACSEERTAKKSPRDVDPGTEEDVKAETESDEAIARAMQEWEDEEDKARDAESKQVEVKASRSAQEERTKELMRRANLPKSSKKIAKSQRTYANFHYMTEDGHEIEAREDCSVDVSAYVNELEEVVNELVDVCKNGKVGKKVLIASTPHCPP